MTKEFKEACRKGNGRMEKMKESTGDTLQCITDHGKLELDKDNRENVQDKVRGQSISEGDKIKMKGTVRKPDTAYYDSLNDRIVAGKKNGGNLSIHNDKDEDNGGGY